MSERERAAARAEHVPVSLYVPTGDLQLLSVPGTSAPRAAAQTPSGLAPLPEASHANALNEATGPSPTPLDAGGEGAAASGARSGTPQRAVAAAQEQGYDGVTVQLTNDRWRERWERMCLMIPGEEDPEPSGMIRSSSRTSLARFGAPVSPGPSDEAKMRAEAEAWRRTPQFQRAEVNLLHGGQDLEGITVLASPWLELDSEDEGIRFDSELALRQELAYAAYLGVSHVVLPAPSSEPERRPFLPDYARAVYTALTGIAGEPPAAGSWMRVSVRLPVSSPHILSTILTRQAERSPRGPTGVPAAAYLRTNDNWAWETWEALQTLCSYHPRLHVALDLSMPLPPATSIARWNAERVSMVWLPSASFLANAKGYPVLSKSAQRLVRQLLRRRPTVVLSDVAAPPPQHTRGGPRAYLQYVRHLCATQPVQSAIEAFAQGYSDWLQAPLQPMLDNLESSTYEVFEQDPVKYALYEEAVFRALADRAPAGATTRIWIVGAGRGILVSRCLEAARRASRAVHITALEKNPNAVIALQDRLVTEWGDEQVTVLAGDMRTLPVPASMSERADMVVSELLGSFADNELCPECLDGAMRFLKPNGLAIPSSYMPFIAPIASAKLHASIRSADDAGANVGSAPASAGMGTTGVRRTGFDMPYVVLMQSANVLSSTGGAGEWQQVQPCWRFEHGPMDQSGLACDASGLPLTNNHNVRTSVNTFHVPHAGVCHGLAGYFEAHLYGDIMLSIHPDADRATENMISWFPFFFPLREPLYVPDNSELEVHLWRLTDDKRVWYEWSAEVFLCLEQGNVPPTPAAADDSASLRESATASVIADTTPSQQPFTNAPETPMMPSSSVVSSNATLDGHTSGLGLATGAPASAGSSGTPSGAAPAVPGASATFPGASPAVPAASASPAVPSTTVSPAVPSAVVSPAVPSAAVSPAPPRPTRRVKVGQTSLMNAGAHGSWIGISQ